MAQGEKGKMGSISHQKEKDAWRKSDIFNGNRGGGAGADELLVLFPPKPGQQEMSMHCNRRD